MGFQDIMTSEYSKLKLNICRYIYGAFALKNKIIACFPKSNL